MYSWLSTTAGGTFMSGGFISRGFRGRRRRTEGDVDGPRTWSWEEFRAFPSEEITRDIHCVTKWSKLATTWEGVSVDSLLEEVETAVEYVVAFCDGGYTTNLPLEDVTGGKAWVAHTYEGEPLAPEH